MKLFESWQSSSQRLIRKQQKHAFPKSATIAICVWVLFASGCVSFCQKKLDNQLFAARMVDVAKESAKAGQDDRAIKLLRESLKRSPQNLEAHTKLVEIYLRQNNTQQAVAQLEHAIDGTRERHQMHVLLGKIYLTSGQVLSAHRQAQLATEMEPSSPAAWELKADVDRAQSKWSDALAAYNRSLELQPRNSSVQLKLCGIYLSSGRPLRALSTVEQLLADTPQSSVPHETLVMHGIILTNLKNYKRAIEQLQTACDQPNSSGESFIRLSNAQLLYGQFSEARATLNVAKAKFPDLTLFDEILAQTTNDNRSAEVASVELSK